MKRRFFRISIMICLFLVIILLVCSKSYAGIVAEYVLRDSNVIDYNEFDENKPEYRGGRRYFRNNNI